MHVIAIARHILYATVHTAIYSVIVWGLLIKVKRFKLSVFVAVAAIHGAAQ